MGTIQTFQPSGAGTFTGNGTVLPNIGMVFSYIGVTTTYTWSLQSKPAASHSSLFQNGGIATFGADVEGAYGIRFTDSSSVNTDITLTVSSLTGTQFDYMSTGNADLFLGVAANAAVGRAGRAMIMGAQDTDLSNLGGSFGIVVGRGFDSNGFQVYEGLAQYQSAIAYLQGFSEGGQNPIFSIVGTGGGTPQLKFQQGDGVILSTGGLYHDAMSTYQFARVNNGTVVYRLGIAGMRLSTDAAVPVEKLEVDGKIQLKSISAPAGSPPAGNFWIYMDSADSKLKCKGPSGTVTPLGLP